MTADLGAERARRARSSKNVSVRDVLKLALQEIESGEEKASSCLIIMLNRGDDGTDRIFSYASGLNTLEEAGLKMRSLLLDEQFGRVD